jgi:hypothetical protein
MGSGDDHERYYIRRHCSLTVAAHPAGLLFHPTLWKGMGYFFGASPVGLLCHCLGDRYSGARLAILDRDNLWKDISPKVIEPPTPPAPSGFRSIPNLNKTYEQNIKRERLNKDRKAAYRLLAMHNNNMKTILTEKFWYEDKATAIFEQRNEMLAWRDRWVTNRILYRLSDKKNSTFDVLDWDKVRWVADGKELPLQ